MVHSTVVEQQCTGDCYMIHNMCRCSSHLVAMHYMNWELVHLVPGCCTYKCYMHLDHQLLNTTHKMDDKLLGSIKDRANCEPEVQ